MNELGERVGQLSMRIDAIQFGRLNEQNNDCLIGAADLLATPASAQTPK